MIVRITNFLWSSKEVDFKNISTDVYNDVSRIDQWYDIQWHELRIRLEREHDKDINLQLKQDKNHWHIISIK